MKHFLKKVNFSSNSQSLDTLQYTLKYTKIYFLIYAKTPVKFYWFLISDNEFLIYLCILF